ncbi:MAG: toll/interleukin-1 receptor domain-containing protein [Leptolyngbyaceae cyanobacterium]
MGTIFLSYARADGKAAATRLRAELQKARFQVWQDIEDMQGGQAWKEQLRAALRMVDGVAVLLTPAAVASKNVEWEWENALTLEKPVFPLLMMPCSVPEELQRLHYHNLSTEQDYVMGLLSLLRDLDPISANQDNPQTPLEASKTGDRNIARSGTVTHQHGKYNTQIGKAQNLRIGDDYNG